MPDEVAEDTAAGNQEGCEEKPAGRAAEVEADGEGPEEGCEEGADWGARQPNGETRSWQVGARGG